MSEDMIIKHCSPTLAGIKTGNLFSTRYTSKRDITDFVRRFNNVMRSKGVRALPLKFNKDRALIYVFRPSLLATDLSDEYTFSLLRNQGYCSDSVSGCIARLRQRVSNCSEFPHEIGLFLGYPPEDVNGFIIHKGNCCKLTGCWKVYANEEEALKKFARYKKCSDIYYSKWLQGTPIQKLTVATRETSVGKNDFLQ